MEAELKTKTRKSQRRGWGGRGRGLWKPGDKKITCISTKTAMWMEKRRILTQLRGGAVNPQPRSGQLEWAESIVQALYPERDSRSDG